LRWWTSSSAELSRFCRKATVLEGKGWFPSGSETSFGPPALLPSCRSTTAVPRRVQSTVSRRHAPVLTAPFCLSARSENGASVLDRHPVSPTEHLGAAHQVLSANHLLASGSLCHSGPTVAQTLWAGCPPPPCGGGLPEAGTQPPRQSPSPHEGCLRRSSSGRFAGVLPRLAFWAVEEKDA